MSNLEPQKRIQKPDPLLGAAMTIAPAAVGCAVGLLLGDNMKRKNRESVATALFTLGALSVVPVAVEYASGLIAGPNSKRGSQRTLRGIRDGGGLHYDESVYGPTDIGSSPSAADNEFEDYSADLAGDAA